METLTNKHITAIQRIIEDQRDKLILLSLLVENSADDPDGAKHFIDNSPTIIKNMIRDSDRIYDLLNSREHEELFNFYSRELFGEI
ncbi:MAG: hypothetical protein Q4A55_00145 [Aerococcus sp.]|nr:hypothetical protein [Aerococcus sp.]